MSGGRVPDRSRRVSGFARRRGSAAKKEVECQLCPRGCRIPPNHSGDCRVRINVDGRLIASTFGRPCAMHLDPIEKKPLYHFFIFQWVILEKKRRLAQKKSS